MDAEPKRLNYIDALWQSFFSQSLYIDVAKRWPGIGFLYLLLVVVLCWLPDLTKMQMGFQQFRGGAAEGYIRQVPTINIADGAASADVQTPYFIKDPDNGQVMAIIDFTGQYTSLDNTPAALLLTRRDVMLRQSGRESRTYSLSGVKDFTVDQARLRRWVNMFLTGFVAIVAPFVIAFSYIFRMAQAAVYGAVGIAFASSYRIKLTYDTLVRLTCVAMTPMLVFTAVTDRIPSLHIIPRFLGWLIHIVIALWYVSFAVKACASAPAESFRAPSAPAPLA